MNQTQDISYAVLFLMPVAAVICIFTLLTVLGWARERRRERESFYRHETARKLIEQGGMTFEQFSAFQREEAARPLAARRRALTLSGAVLLAGGVMLYGAFKGISPEAAPGLRELRSLGYVPAGIGGALLVCAFAGGKKKDAE